MTSLASLMTPMPNLEVLTFGSGRRRRCRDASQRHGYGGDGDGEQQRQGAVLVGGSVGRHGGLRSMIDLRTDVIGKGCRGRYVCGHQVTGLGRTSSPRRGPRGMYVQEPQLPHSGKDGALEYSGCVSSKFPKRFETTEGGRVIKRAPELTGTNPSTLSGRG